MMNNQIETTLTKEEIDVLIATINSEVELMEFDGYNKEDLLNTELMRFYFIRARLHEKLSAMKNR